MYVYKSRGYKARYKIKLHVKEHILCYLDIVIHKFMEFYVCILF